MDLIHPLASAEFDSTVSVGVYQLTVLGNYYFYNTVLNFTILELIF